MNRDYDIEYEPNPDDERDVPLDEEEPSPPPTIDPEERVEETDAELVEDDERPV
jgi:hypothetical protein